MTNRFIRFVEENRFGFIVGLLASLFAVWIRGTSDPDIAGLVIIISTISTGLIFALIGIKRRIISRAFLLALALIILVISFVGETTGKFSIVEQTPGEFSVVPGEFGVIGELLGGVTKSVSEGTEKVLAKETTTIAKIESRGFFKSILDFLGFGARKEEGRLVIKTLAREEGISLETTYRDLKTGRVISAEDAKVLSKERLKLETSYRDIKTGRLLSAEEAESKLGILARSSEKPIIKEVLKTTENVVWRDMTRRGTGFLVVGTLIGLGVLASYGIPLAGLMLLALGIPALFLRGILNSLKDLVGPGGSGMLQWILVIGGIIVLLWLFLKLFGRE